MGKPKSPAKKTAPINPDVVVGEHQPVSNRLVMWAVAGIALLLLGMGFVWMTLGESREHVVNKTPVPSDVDTNYATTDIKNIPLLLKHDFDLTVEDASKGKFGKNVRSASDAEKVGMALRRLGKESVALRAYDLAITRAPRNDRYGLYVQQIFMANKIGDVEATKHAYNQAKKIVQSWPPEDQKEVLSELEDVFRNTKAGQAKE